MCTYVCLCECLYFGMHIKQCTCITKISGECRKRDTMKKRTRYRWHKCPGQKISTLCYPPLPKEMEGWTTRRMGNETAGKVDEEVWRAGACVCMMTHCVTRVVDTRPALHRPMLTVRTRAFVIDRREGAQ